MIQGFGSAAPITTGQVVFGTSEFLGLYPEFIPVAQQAVGAVATASLATTGVLTVTAVASGAIAPGQLVGATGLAAGATAVASFGNGSGGTGTYNVTPAPAQAIGSETFTFYPATLLLNAFNIAQQFVNNTIATAVQDANLRQTLLYLLTAHVVALSPTGGVNGQAPSGLVGRISDASEGSVSAGTEYSSTITNSQAYFVQTQYGAQYWALIAQFRTMVYVPPACGLPGALGAPYGLPWGPQNGPPWGAPYGPYGTPVGVGNGVGPTGTGYPGWDGGDS